MEKCKKVFFSTLSIIIATSLFWVYLSIDNGVTYTYQQVTLEDKSRAVRILSELIIKGGQKYTKKDILHILRQLNKDAFIIEKNNLIDIEGVQFIFINGKLSKVKG